MNFWSILLSLLKELLRAIARLLCRLVSKSKEAKAKGKPDTDIQAKEDVNHE